MIDLLRQYPPAITWFDALDETELLALSGFVVMELIQGCRNKAQQTQLQRDLAAYQIIWLSSKACDQALNIFAQYHLSHNAGLLDVLVGQTAISLDIPLHTFNRKHYQFIPGLQIVQPYHRFNQPS